MALRTSRGVIRTLYQQYIQEHIQGPGTQLGRFNLRVLYKTPQEKRPIPLCKVCEDRMWVIRKPAPPDTLDSGAWLLDTRHSMAAYGLRCTVCKFLLHWSCFKTCEMRDLREDTLGG